ncbi:MAG: hypothetical protein JKX76_00980 [Colwellia sp.]|nr:hypothetical protein [Colwellia sp.]
MPNQKSSITSKVSKNKTTSRKLGVQLSQSEQILLRPDTYIGSVEKEIVNELIFSSDDGGILLKKDIEIIPGLMRIFIEVISNAIDNKWRSEESNIQFKEISVDINPESGLITVYNDGAPVPIEMVQQSDGTELYNPELIFGHFCTSTNYDDEEERLTSGRNGFGVKLTNLFSTEFNIECFDPHTSQLFKKTWTNNMYNAAPFELTSKTGTKGYTKISFIPDFAKFKVNGWTEDHLSLIQRHVVDMAMLTRVKVKFNGETINVKNLKDYAALFPVFEYILEDVENDDNTSSLASPSRSPARSDNGVEETKGGDSPTKKKLKDFVYLTFGGCEVLVMPSEVHEQISFVNGVNTTEGGVHVADWIECIFRPVLEKALKNEDVVMKINEVVQFFRIFVIYTVPNPTFKSQSKEKLTAPKPSVETGNSITNSILKWDASERIKQLLHEKGLRNLRTNTKGKTTGIKGYDEANKCGKKYGRECALIVCEGDSAKTFVVSGLKTGVWGKTGRDYFGILPLTGKILNVRKATITAISKNKIIVNIIKVIGLDPQLDYTIDSNFNKLNYGRMISLCDADVDGFHIQGLLINIFHAIFPSLLNRQTPFFYNMATPIVTVKHNNKLLEFYDQHESRAFIMANNIKSKYVSYYKGLGTFKKEKVALYFGKRIVEYSMDTLANSNMNKVFHGAQANARKEWLGNFNPENINRVIEELVSGGFTQDLTNFLDNDLIQHGIDNNRRTIPSVVDGFKDSQRKIMFVMLRDNLTKARKVSQLSGRISEHSEYHHGEQNLQETIVKLAQLFVGANNIPLLQAEGQFGSRLQGGDDAASARYIFSATLPIARLIFPKMDDAILNYKIEDGASIEPEYYVPVIPLILANGAKGIGTGWSTTIPGYHPLELCVQIKLWLDGEPLIELIPWYKGFTGNIVSDGDKKWKTEGTFTRKGRVITITELPIGLWTDKYKTMLETMAEKKVFTSFTNNSDDEIVNFVIKENPIKKPLTLKNLKLTSSICTTNLSLFDPDGIMKRYANTSEIIDDYCQIRYGHYTLRRDKMIESITSELVIMRNKQRYIASIVDGTLIINNVPEEDIIAVLIAHEYFNMDSPESDDLDEQDDEFDASVLSTKGFNYLLDIRTRWLSKSKIDWFSKQIEKKESDLDLVVSKDEKQMWLEDLDNFEQQFES